MVDESEHKQTGDGEKPLTASPTTEAGAQAEPSAEPEAATQSQAAEPSEAVGRGRAKPSGFSLGWFWQAQKAKELKAELASRPERYRVLLGRGRACLAAARALKSESEAVEPSSNTILAQIYLEAIRWALEAVRVAEDATAPPLRLADVAGRLRPGEGTLREEAIVSYEALSSQSEAELWETTPKDEVVAQLEALARDVFELAERPVQALEDIWFSRLLRVGVPLVVMIAIGLAGGAFLRRATLLQETDIPWKASSKFPSEKGCESPHQECAETRFFFCTNEQDNPWIEFELDKGKSVSRVTIKNRTDCAECAARPVPLVVEVSNDHREWKEVARKNESFEEWKATFPKERAKWVRLRSLKRTFLHLQQVRISE